MARPTKADSEKVPMMVGLRLTEVDHAELMAKCRNAGLTPSEFMRDYVLRNRTQVVARSGPPSTDMRRVLFLWGKASNNINQLAHRANFDHLTGHVSEATYRHILGELDAISRQLKEFHHVA